MVKRGVSLCIAFVTMALFLMPCCKVYAEVTEEQNFYHWWVVEKTTEDYNRHHGGGGFGFNAAAEMEDIATKYGLSTEQIIHNFCNITTEEYEEFIKENYGVDVDQVFNDMFYNTPLTPETRQLYATSRANRVDNEGNINVSGSNFWRSAYNQMFNGGGYNDSYHYDDNGYTIPTYDLNIRYVGLCNPYNYGVSVVENSTVSPYIVRVSGGTRFLSGYENIIGTGNNTVQVGCTVNGYYLSLMSGNYTSGGISDISSDGNAIVIHAYGVGQNNATRDMYLTLSVSVNDDDINHSTIPVKNPYSVGFIKYPLGQKTPVYTPDSGEENPFEINDNGTVTMDEDDDQSTLPTTYPIWINPDDLSDDGWKTLFKNVNDDDNTDSPVNPYSKPWNTKDDGTILGGLFSNLIKDIGSLFSSIADAIKKVIDNILNIPKFITDALKNFFSIDYEEMTDFDTDIDFDIITIIFNKLLELLGVT